MPLDERIRACQRVLVVGKPTFVRGVYDGGCNAFLGCSRGAGVLQKTVRLSVWANAPWLKVEHALRRAFRQPSSLTNRTRSQRVADAGVR